MRDMLKKELFKEIIWFLIIAPIGVIFLPFSLGLLIIDFLTKSGLRQQFKHFLIMILVILITTSGAYWLNEIIFPQAFSLRIFLKQIIETKYEFQSGTLETAGNDSIIYEIAQVLEIIDGDTIRLIDGRKVRYIGIDTPELIDSLGGTTCYAKEAAGKNKNLVMGRMVRLERDISDKDKYGRLLRYVYVDDIFINKKLVEEGYAVAVAYPPDLKYQLQLKEAERHAFDNNLGLWKECRRQPKDYNKERVENLQYCVIKGNIEEGEKFFYYPGCPSFYDITIEERMGEKWFCTEEEARYFGWQKAAECL